MLYTSPQLFTNVIAITCYITIFYTYHDILYCLKINTISFPTFFDGNVFLQKGDRTLFVFGGKGLWRKQQYYFDGNE